MPVPDTSVLHATGGRTVETQPGDVRRARAARLYMYWQTDVSKAAANTKRRSSSEVQSGRTDWWFDFFTLPLVQKGQRKAVTKHQNLRGASVAAHGALA